MRTLGAIGFLVLLTTAVAAEKDAPVLTQQKPKSYNLSLGQFYGSFELRHHLNTYYNAEGYRSQQDPALHARLRFGSLLYGGQLDVYAVLGVIKTPQSQQMLGRRPEIEVDYYPVSTRFARITQYNIVQLPYERETHEFVEAKPEKQGTIYILGLVPTLMLPADLGSSTLEFKLGSDVWTEFFSRRQARDPEEKFALAATGEEREDQVLRLYSEYMAGLSVVPGFMKLATLEASMYYDIFYRPEYEEAGGVENYHYVSERNSHYRLRLQVKLREDLEMSNEFYHYHEGFFARKRSGEDRRFRNILQLTCFL